jgi:hypothetical protein
MAIAASKDICRLDNTDLDGRIVRYLPLQVTTLLDRPASIQMAATRMFGYAGRIVQIKNTLKGERP